MGSTKANFLQKASVKPVLQRTWSFTHVWAKILQFDHTGSLVYDCNKYGNVLSDKPQHSYGGVVWCDHTVVGFVKVLGFCCGCFVPRCHFFPLRLSWHFSSINFFSLSPCFLWIWLNFPLITYNWIWATITFVPLVFLMLIATQLFFLPFFLFSSSLFFLFLNLKSFNLPFATLVGSRQIFQ